MLCKGCGNQISNEYVFCPNCGYKNEPGNIPKNTKKCSECGKEFPEDRFFCDSCGGKLAPITSGQTTSNSMQSHSTQGFSQSNSNVQSEIPYTTQPNSPYQSSQQATHQSSQNTPPYQTSQNSYYQTSQNASNQTSNSQPYQASQNQFYQNQNTYYNNAANSQYQPQQNAPYHNGYQKKKNKYLLPIILGSSAVVLLLLAVILIPIILDELRVDDSYSYEVTDSEDISTDVTSDSTTTEPVITESPSADTVSSPSYTLYYDYTELSDVASLNSDSRFAYNSYDPSQDIFTYEYIFTETSPTESSFFGALDEYSVYLQNNYGFYYEEDLSEEQSEEGNPIIVLSRGIYYMTISGNVPDYYAYISIFILDDEETTEETTIDSTTDTSMWTNITNYIQDRDYYTIELGTETIMENGMSFYLNEITFTDLGNGTMELLVDMDLSAYNSDIYAAYSDFMVVPTDDYGNILADASPASYYTDSSGNDVTAPFVLDTAYYYNYTLTFYVPAETTDFTFTANNLDNNYQPAGPIYRVDMEIY
ncbi:MAG: hypothetical protein K0S47_374 [Herbinix sp.]|nr:hypothetical protein [Herbinix sp.]